MLCLYFPIARKFTRYNIIYVKTFLVSYYRFIIYKQPGSILSWISKFIAAAILSLLIGCIYWDVPTSDPQLNLNDRLGYHYAVMSICLWPILLLVIRDIHEDRMYAEKDFYLGMYGRLIYILTQVRIIF